MDQTVSATDDDVVQTDPMASRAVDSLRILIVEDDELQASLLRNGLAARGFKVDTVANGLEAVEQMDIHHYDAAVVDYGLPSIDGLASAKLIREFLGPVARPALVARTASPGKLQESDSGIDKVFDCIVDKSVGISAVAENILLCLKFSPDIQTKLEARAALHEQQEQEYHQGPHRPLAQGNDPGPIRMLVAEDDEGDRRMLKSVFERRGFVVETASNGMQAIQSATKGHFDIALIDYNMPEIDGATVASLIHYRMEQSWRPRLIAYTATPDVVVTNSLQVGPLFDTVLAKSAGIRVLLQTVSNLLCLAPNPDTRRASAKLSWPNLPTLSETTNDQARPGQS